MTGIQERRIGLIATLIASFVLYQFTLFYVLFLVPLHVLALRRDRKDFLLVSAGVALAILIQEISRMVRFGAGRQESLLLAVGLFVPLAFVGGAVFFHAALPSVRRLYRFLLQACLTGLCALVLIAVYEAGGQAAENTKTLIVEQLRILMTGMDGEPMFGIMDVEMLYTLAIAILERTFLSGMMLQSALMLGIGYLIAGRMTGNRFFRITGFHVPERLLWPSLVIWAGMLVDAIFPLSLFGIACWNAGLVLAMVYGTQGIAICLHLLGRRGVRLRLSTMVIWSVVLLLIPGVNVLCMIGMPLVGLSEIWIRYRDVKEENPYENHS